MLVPRLAQGHVLKACVGIRLTKGWEADLQYVATDNEAITSYNHNQLDLHSGKQTLNTTTL